MRGPVIEAIVRRSRSQRARVGAALSRAAAGRPTLAREGEALARGQPERAVHVEPRRAAHRLGPAPRAPAAVRQLRRAQELRRRLRRPRALARQ
eukprot:1711549-Pleurochrysis_carterae.AAC.2